MAASARSHAGCRGDSRRPAGRYVGVCLSAAHALELGLGGTLTVGAYRRSLRQGIGTGRPGIEDELRELGLPVVTPGQRLSQVRDTVTSLRELDGPDLHTPVVMAVRGPKAQALAADLADTVTFFAMPGDSRAEIMRLADPAALRAVDSLLVLPSDPTAATEEILRRREEGGFSYIVVGANAADALAPVVAELTGH